MFIRTALLASILTIIVSCAGVLLFGADRGLDLTDETFYLIWIDDPAAYAISYQPFGYVLNPLYELLGRSIALMRAAGVFVTLAAGAVLGLTCERFLRAAYPTYYRHDGSLALFGALASLANYVYWLATPNYNFLGNVGACLAGAGLVSWITPVAEKRPAVHVSSVLVGLGFYISFFGKPPLAMIELFAAALILVLQARRGLLLRSLQRAALSAAFAAVLGGATTLRIGDPLAFLPTMLESLRVLDLGISLAQLPVRLLRDIYYAPPIFPISLLAFLLVMTLRELEPGQTRWLRVLLVFLFLGNLALFSMRAVAAIGAGDRPPYMGLTLIGAVLLWIAYAQLRRPLPLRVLALPLALAFAPFAIALGTFNSVAGHVTTSISFVLLSACLLARLTLDPRVGMWLQIGIAGLVLLLVGQAALRPHEYAASIFEQTEPLRMPLSAKPIFVDRTTKAYADELAEIARKNGFKPGSPVLDLSAGGPGTAILLGARAPVLPWITHITPHWADFVWARMSPEERQQAWVVGPIHPVFGETRVARYLARKLHLYRCAGTTKMKIWGRMRIIGIWNPAASPARQDAICPPALRSITNLSQPDL